MWFDIGKNFVLVKHKHLKVADLNIVALVELGKFAARREVVVVVLVVKVEVAQVVLVAGQGEVVLVVLVVLVVPVVLVVLVEVAKQVVAGQVAGLHIALELLGNFAARVAVLDIVAMFEVLVAAVLGECKLPEEGEFHSILMLIFAMQGVFHHSIRSVYQGFLQFGKLV